MSGGLLVRSCGFTSSKAERESERARNLKEAPGCVVSVWDWRIGVRTMPMMMMMMMMMMMLMMLLVWAWVFQVAVIVVTAL